jgi:hypothetical protein
MRTVVEDIRRCNHRSRCLAAVDYNLPVAHRDIVDLGRTLCGGRGGGNLGSRSYGLEVSVARVEEVKG